MRDTVTVEGEDVVSLEPISNPPLTNTLPLYVCGQMPDVPRKQATCVRVSPELRDCAVSYTQQHHRKLNAVVQEALKASLRWQKNQAVP